MKRILILNGSPVGEKGNCGTWIKKIQSFLKKKAKVDIVHLAKKGFSATLKSKIEKADALVFVTGTYWDSWGSPMQKLLEDMTPLEATSALLGKPAAVFVLMHSVGGKSVLSRLQGVLSTMGLTIPPMSGMVYSLVTDLALKGNTSHAKDFWQIEDAELILENLLRGCDVKVPWEVWPVDRKDARRRWLQI